jgi:hypothetical protein
VRTLPRHVQYTDAAERSKINFRVENSPTSEKYLPETMGAEVSHSSITTDLAAKAGVASFRLEYKRRIFGYDNNGEID